MNLNIMKLKINQGIRRQVFNLENKAFDYSYQFTNVFFLFFFSIVQHCQSKNMSH